MPIATDPKATFDYVLESDRKKPKKEQPAFVCKVLSTAKWRKVIEMDSRLADIEGDLEQLNIIFEVIQFGVIGWRNMSIGNSQLPYNRDNLEDVLTLPEAAELMQAVVAQGITIEDKKKLEPQSPSATVPAEIKVASDISSVKESQTPPKE